jgi:steroid delta-isomerase-like uncharacterized protein
MYFMTCLSQRGFVEAGRQERISPWYTVLIMTETKIIQTFLDAENKRDWEVWSSFLDPNVTYESVGSDSPVQGKENYLNHMKQAYSELDDWHFTITHLLHKDDIVMVEFDGKGHFTGMYKGKEYINTPLRLQALCIFELQNGLIKTVREYWDPVGYEKQLTS